MRFKTDKIINFPAAFFGCWAIQVTSGITVRNPLTVVLFLCLFMAASYVGGFRLRKDAAGGGDRMRSLGYLFQILPNASGVAIGCIVAKMLYPSASEEFTNSLFKAMTFGILFVGYYLMSWLLVRLLIVMVRKRDFVKADGLERKKWQTGKWVRKMPDKRGLNILAAVSAVFCFICYLPYFLYEFPGIMTADSIVQYQQIIGVLPLSNHHPVIHTMAIKLFYELGLMVTGDPVRAISFYTLAQMIFMSICCGVLVKEVVTVMGRLDLRILAAVIAFLALFPVNAVFAVTVWKDVPFAGIAVLLVCHLLSMCRKGAEKLTMMDFGIFSILGVLFSLFRSNAWYAFIVFAPVFVWYFRVRLKESLAAALLTIVLVIAVKGPAFSAVGVTGPDFVESLSLPLQQVARVLVDEKSVTDSDMAMIDDVIDRTYIKELYVGEYADNIKELVRAGNPAVLEEHKPEYFSLWMRMGLRNPGEYIAAWYDLEGGYIYPDVDYRVADADGIMPNDEGLYPMPIIGGKFIKVKEILLKLSEFMPLYGMLFSIGAYAWGLVISLFVAILKKRNMLPHILMLLLVLTLLIAAPVVDFRYGYAYVLTFPVILAVSFAEDYWGIEDD